MTTIKRTESDFHFIQDWLWRVSVLDAYNAVITCGLCEYIKSNELTSFVFPRTDDGVDLKNLYRHADARAMHSGASFGMTMREVERIFKMGYDDWKIWYIRHNRPDIVHKIHIISRQVKKRMSDPTYAMCRRRLRREFFELAI